MTTEDERMPSDAMVDAYLKAQRETVEEADRNFGRPNVGGLHTNTVREACRNGLKAALSAQPAPKGESDDLTIAYMVGYGKGVEDGANRHLLASPPPSITQRKAPEPKK